VRAGRVAEERSAQYLGYRAQQALMLVEIRGAIPLLYVRADQRDGHLAAAVRTIALISLVPPDDEQAVFLELRAVQQRRDLVLQELVRGPKDVVVGAIGAAVGAIVRVMLQVGHDEGEIRQRVIGDVRGELRERYDVVLLPRAVTVVAEVCKGIVVLHVGVRIPARVARVRDRLGVGLPGLPRFQQFTLDVVGADGAVETIIISDDLSGREFEIIPDRGVCVGVKAVRQRIRTDERIQVRHRRIADHSRITMVLKGHYDHVSQRRRGLRT